MPANLTPEYLDAEREYKQARTPQDRLEALRKMLATVPKHKGTEKLQADIKRRISKLMEEMQKSSRRKGFAISVPKEGAGQVALVGAPNTGKSRLVAALTHATPEVAPYPFTTRSPYPAMMPFENVQVQLVDLPPFYAQHLEPWVAGIVRTADAALIVFDLGCDDPLEQLEETFRLLRECKIKPVAGEPVVDPWASVVEKKCLLVANKADVPGAAENFVVLQELYGDTYPMLPVSAERGDGIEQLRRGIFRMLNVLRVYSKPPGKEADLSRPFVLRRPATLLQFANLVHHDFGEKLRYARVWGDGKFDGQRVTKEYELQDGDVVELHI
ncbi:MAG: TGS domain-containing protein [candidate division KSB1 bacterium]|nr:TGS domain-containing protein [candidate division KSB1 bacterium]MDZ7377919.1 TGS domain-containing protein [candidate division KSB1 bacterium]MDZ7385345.1 TGS domain-containing protein [candidate division KSB1 bacterium]MDZ7392469.1 TGS domain-containing protein [candidate division KSB1 bacterium]MDZ7412242.1 TGS domain-containing protein [candidate division KSB1 bacterium]